MTDYNLPEPDDMPWALGLSKEDVQKLREDKKRLSEYGKQKIAEFMKNQTIIAKVSEEDYQKVLDAFEERKASIPENDEIEDILNIELTEEKKQELAEQREKLNAGFKQDADGNWYRPTLQELEKNERIDLAINEMRYIVWGGQDGEEFGNSVKFIVDVLNSLKDE